MAKIQICQCYPLADPDPIKIIFPAPSDRSKSSISDRIRIQHSLQHENISGLY